MKRRSRLLLLIVKILVSAALLAVIIGKAGPRDILSHLQAMDLRFFFLVSLLHILLLLFTALRLRLLLDEERPFWKLFSLCMIGSFFNHILPGAIGGDAVKAYYLYQDTQKRVSSMGSVVMDRYVGFCGLLSVGLVSGFVAFGELRLAGLHWLIPSLAVFFLAGSLLLFRLRIGRRFAVVSDLYDYFSRVLKNREAVLKAYVISIVIQAITIAMIYFTARGIGVRLPFTALFVFVPVIITVTMIPVSISGLGVRESAFVVLFGLAGVPAGAAASISFLWYLSATVGSLTGLVEYVRYRRSSS